MFSSISNAVYRSVIWVHIFVIKGKIILSHLKYINSNYLIFDIKCLILKSLFVFPWSSHIFLFYFSFSNQHPNKICILHFVDDSLKPFLIYRCSLLLFWWLFICWKNINCFPDYGFYWLSPYSVIYYVPLPPILPMNW